MSDSDKLRPQIGTGLSPVGLPVELVGTGGASAGASLSPELKDTGLFCLLMLARFFGLPADGEQLRHQFSESGTNLSETDLLRAAKHLGFKAGFVQSDWSQLAKAPLPAIAQQKDGRYVVVAKAESDKVLVQDPLEGRPMLLPKAAFVESWSGKLMLLTKRAQLRPQD